MDRASLAMGRVMFFVMLFISSACNKMDASQLKGGLAEVRPAVVAAEPVADATRVRELEGRVALLEAELKVLNRDAQAYGSIPGGVTWD